MSVQEVFQKIKEWSGEGGFLLILLILVVLGAFGLGRLSAMDANRTPSLRTEKVLGEDQKEAGGLMATPVAPIEEPTAPGLPAQTGGRVVASKNGARYHFPWCSGAKRIAKENEVWFESPEEARKEGYTPASNCKGLE